MFCACNSLQNTEYRHRLLWISWNWHRLLIFFCSENVYWHVWNVSWGEKEIDCELIDFQVIFSQEALSQCSFFRIHPLLLILSGTNVILANLHLHAIVKIQSGIGMQTRLLKSKHWESKVKQMQPCSYHRKQLAGSTKAEKIMCLHVAFFKKTVLGQGARWPSG